jgi:hypothetical protein
MPRRGQFSNGVDVGERVVAPFEIGWLAGIVDGEGCISLGVNRKKYVTPTVQISNTDIRLAEWLIEHCGGSYYVRHDEERGRKTTYNWRCAGHQARALVALIAPHLKLKDRQARVVLGMSLDQMSPERLENDMRAVRSIRVLNRRGKKVKR